MSLRALTLSALILSQAAVAQERVPDALGLMVILKVASYDTAFPTHGSGDFVVLIPFAAGQEGKATALAAVGDGLEVKSIKDRPLRFRPVPLAELDVKKGTAVLLHPGFAAGDLASVLEKTRAQKLYVFALDEALVRSGAVLGVALSNGKPQPLVNVPSAHALNADFGPVLRVARLFQ